MKYYYLSGVAVAFCFALIQVVMSLSKYLSVQTNNYNKIGLYYSFSQVAYTAESKPTILKFVGYLLNMLVLTPVISWLYVFCVLFYVVHSIVNKVPVPEKIKEIKFILSTINLPKERVEDLNRQISHFYGITDNKTNKICDTTEEGNFTLVLDIPSDWHAEYVINPLKYTLMYYSRDPDFGEYHSFYEYKFCDNKLLIRLLEDFTEHPGKIEYEVRDNVVMEYDILKRDAKDKFRIGNIDDKINKLKKSVEWNDTVGIRLKYFIMSKHPDIFRKQDIRKMIRQDIERIKNGTRKLINKGKKLNVKIERYKDGLVFLDSGNCNDNLSKEVKYFLTEESFLSMGVSWSEVNHYNEHLGDLYSSFKFVDN